MATQSSFKQQCPSCEAMVPIRDPKLIGRKIDCPKCKYRFVVEEPVDEVDEVEEEAPAKKGKAAAGITNKKPANGKAGKPALQRRADDDEDQEDSKPKKKQSGGSGMLILGIGLAAVAVIALAIGAVFLFSDDKEEKNPSGKPSASVTPQGGADDVKPPEPSKNKPKEELKPRQEDVTNLLPNDTQAVLNLPLEHLLGNGKVKQALLKTPGAFQESAFQRIWGITPSDIRRVVLAYNVEKKTVFSVMRTSMPMNEKQIVGGLKLRAEAPIGELKYYLLQKPLDTLSTFLLKGGEHHDKAALHFIDAFTVVCADRGPMNQFLQAKGQPKQLSKQAAEEPADGGAKGGPPGGMMGMQGGPPGGMMNMKGGPSTGMQGGRPGGGPGGFQPTGVSGPGAPGGTPGGRMPPNMGQGGGGEGDVAPVSSSYMTVDPHLKAVLDQVEKADKKENQNVLLSLALSTSAVPSFLEIVKPFLDGIGQNIVVQSGINTSRISPDWLKLGLEFFQSQGKAAAVAVTEFSQSKISVNAATEFADAKLAQQIEQKASEFLPDFLTSTGLDLVAKNAGGNNMAGMAGGMQGMQGGMQPGGGPGGFNGMQPPGAGFNGMRPPGAGFNGMQPPGGGPGGIQPADEGEKKEEKGKLGDYLTWSKDNVIALGANFKIATDTDSTAGKTLQYVGVYVRGVSAMSERQSRIHELAAATQAYLDKTGHFPRGTVPRAADSQHVLGWRPDQRLSWMTQLLPYLDNGAFQNLKPEDDKSWYEGFNNQKAGLTVIPQFVTPIASDNPIYFYVQYPNLHVDGPGLWAATHYVGMAGVGLDAAEYRAGDAATAKLRGVFGYDRETKKTDIKDGLDQTIVLIQVPPEPKSPWIAGGGSTVRGVAEDLECVQPFVSTEYKGKRGTFAIMADGKVRFIPASIDPKTFQAMCTIAGGDKIKGLDNIAPEVPPPDDLANQPELKAEPPAPRPPAGQAAPSPKTPAGWKDYTSKEGGFTVSLPAGKVVQQTKEATLPTGKLTIHIYGIELPGGAGVFVTMYNDYPQAVLAGGPDAILKGVRLGAAAMGKGAKITSESEIRVEGHPGREWIVNIPGQGDLKWRAFLVRNRLYQLMAGAEPKKVPQKDVQAFFDSFKLIGK